MTEINGQGGLNKIEGTSLPSSTKGLSTKQIAPGSANSGTGVSPSAGKVLAHLAKSKDPIDDGQAFKVSADVQAALNKANNRPNQGGILDLAAFLLTDQIVDRATAA